MCDKLINQDHVSSFNTYLSYYCIDHESRQFLGKYSAEIIKFLPQILDSFCNHVTSHPANHDGLLQKFPEPLKQILTKHWEQLLSGKFSETFVQQSNQYGKHYQNYGFAVPILIGSYSQVLTLLTGQISKKFGRRRSRCQKLINTVTSITMMDMELALDGYLDAENTAKAKATVTNFADKMADKNVELSMSTNAVAIQNVSMLRSLEAVNSQAQTIADAAREMANGIAVISQNSDEVAKAAGHVQDETQKGKQVIEKTAANMSRTAEAVRQASERAQSLAAKSENIVNLVESIEQIANQTNLLALNATIEAARAGDTGKGFAVVAGEVKDLASQTAKTTVDIRETVASLTADIDGIVSFMADGAQAVMECEDSMQAAVSSIDLISESIDQTSGRMTEISSILTEQNTVSHEVSSNAGTVAVSTQQNVSAISASIDAANDVVQLITEQLATLSEFDIPNKSIRIAKSDHIVWKKRLADMMAGRQALYPDELTSHHNCRLGKWYYGEDGEKHKDVRAYKELEEPHKLIHECGIEAVHRFNAGDIDGAMEMFSKVDAASKDVIRLLDELIDGKLGNAAE